MPGLVVAVGVDTGGTPGLTGLGTGALQVGDTQVREGEHAALRRDGGAPLHAVAALQVRGVAVLGGVVAVAVVHSSGTPGVGGVLTCALPVLHPAVGEGVGTLVLVGVPPPTVGPAGV